MEYYYIDVMAGCELNSPLFTATIVRTFGSHHKAWHLHM